MSTFQTNPQEPAIWVYETAPKSTLHTPSPAPLLVSLFNQLGLAEDGFLGAVLPFVLSRALYPHSILQEIARIVKPEGLICFVEYQPWHIENGLHGFQRLQQHQPWCFLPRWRLSEWLRILGLDPVESGTSSKVYWLVVQKKRLAWIPVRLKWPTHPVRVMKPILVTGEIRNS